MSTKFRREDETTKLTVSLDLLKLAGAITKHLPEKEPNAVRAGQNPIRNR